MTSDQIRAAFLAFFVGQGHQVVPSSSLIPRGDPTLLLTTAGMVQFKPYFLGTVAPPSRRLTSCQKCFRTTDIESVGDPGHLTFFEMLGNFSIGDYFKREAIGWGWQFVTRELGLPADRLWVTVFRDDDEAFGYWRDIGVPEARIRRFDAADNFWGPAGSSGPCGPCSEIHFDFGEGVGCGRATCAPNCGCPRFLEIWNLVFVQYNQDETGRRTPLPRPSIDTGMGLERITAAVAGKTSVYETDIFAPLLGRIGTLSGRQYGAGGEADRAMRVVAEHSRGLAFLIADGVIPANEGRGYVLRRLLRRAALFGRRLGLDKPFLAESARTTIEQMQPLYPELAQRWDFIVKAIELEEARFGETLSAGLELMDSLMARQGGEIAGADAFRLYDTYGFPVELTGEVAAGRGFTVDMVGFEKEMAKQRERGRAAHRFGGAVAGAEGSGAPLNGRQTAFVGYDRLEHQSVITDLLVDGHPAATVVKGQEASLVLAATPFYGEMGGQAGDTGRIEASSGSFTVSDTVRLAKAIVHRGYVAEGSLAVGDSVAAVVDGERRQDIARNHTATHLLQAALRQVLGEHVQQRGSLVAPERLRFDFSHLAAMTVEEIQAVQHIVNEKIRQNLAVGSRQLPYKEALAAGALAFFEEQYGDEVRVLSVGTPPVSVELCGGTHVGATGDIGFCCIVSESGIGAGLRRIEAVTGRGAEAYIDQRLAELGRLAAALEAKPEEVVARARALLAELREERRQRLALEREMGRITADSLLERGETVDGVRLIAARVPSARIEALREMSDRLREQLGSGIVVLGSVYDGKPVFLAAVTPDLVGRGYHAGEIVRQVARVAGGGGGGKAELAQAGGKDKDKLDEALRLVPSLVRGRT